MNSNTDMMKKPCHGEDELSERWRQRASEIAGAARELFQNDPDINRFVMLTFKVKDSDTDDGTFYSVIVQRDGETSHSEVLDDLLKENQQLKDEIRQLKDEMEHLQRLYDIAVRLRDNLVEDCSQLQAMNQRLREEVEAFGEEVEESDE